MLTQLITACTTIWGTNSFLCRSNKCLNILWSFDVKQEKNNWNNAHAFKTKHTVVVVVFHVNHCHRLSKIHRSGIGYIQKGKIRNSSFIDWSIEVRRLKTYAQKKWIAPGPQTSVWTIILVICLRICWLFYMNSFIILFSSTQKYMDEDVPKCVQDKRKKSVD